MRQIYEMLLVQRSRRQCLLIADAPRLMQRAAQRHRARDFGAAAQSGRRSGREQVPVESRTCCDDCRRCERGRGDARLCLLAAGADRDVRTMRTTTSLATVAAANPNAKVMEMLIAANGMHFRNASVPLQRIAVSRCSAQSERESARASCSPPAATRTGATPTVKLRATWRQRTSNPKVLRNASRRGRRRAMPMARVAPRCTSRRRQHQRRGDFALLLAANVDLGDSVGLEVRLRSPLRIRTSACSRGSLAAGVKRFRSFSTLRVAAAANSNPRCSDANAARRRRNNVRASTRCR
jgi:hypothetical protein